MPVTWGITLRVAPPAPALALALALSLALPATPALARTHSMRDVTTVYVANYLSDTVTPINAATDTAGAPIGVRGAPFLLAATPDGKTVYVESVDNYAIPPQEYVTPIDTATGKAGTPIQTGGALAMSPDGKTLYVLGGGGLVPIDTATNIAGTPILLNGPAHTMIFAPGGREAYVAVWHGDWQGDVVPVNLATGKTGAPVYSGITDAAGPASLAITPDGKTVYAAGYTGTARDFIMPVATATDKAAPLIFPPGGGFGPMQVSSDGKILYVLASNGFLDRISTATGKFAPPIRIRGGLKTMALVPGSSRAFVGQSNAWGHVVPVNTATGVRGPDIPGARGISVMALAPGGGTLWAVGGSTQTVVPINTATDQPGSPVRVGSDPVALVVVPHRVRHS
jgi:YVTN family beta-propeller protein